MNFFKLSITLISFFSLFNSLAGNLKLTNKNDIKSYLFENPTLNNAISSWNNVEANMKVSAINCSSQMIRVKTSDMTHSGWKTRWLITAQPDAMIPAGQPIPKTKITVTTNQKEDLPPTDPCKKVDRKTSTYSVNFN